MKVDELVEDKLGWVDDFRALPGKCGSPLARKIYLQSLIQQGTSMAQLKQMGFSRDMVYEINTRLVDEEYGPKEGDLVKIRCRAEDNLIGVVTWINLQYPATAGVLIDGENTIQDFRTIEVINESR
jgi:hypothetical protein